MKRITIKTLGAILVFVMLLGALPFTAFADKVINPYEAVYFNEFASATGAHTLYEGGAVGLDAKGAMLKFENVDFYKNTTHLTINYATNKTFTFPRKINVRLDDPEKGINLGTFQLDGTGTSSSASLNYRTMVLEINANIPKGLHDLYITDIEGSSTIYRYFKFSGAWEGDDGITLSYPQEIEILNGLGIADYSYAKAGTLDKAITRRDFAKMVSNLFKVKNISNLTSFYDVPANDPDIKAMTSMVALGVMKADGGYFRPNGTVSLEEAYKILLTIMGFELKTNTTYNGRWSLMATETGLTSGVKGSLSAALTYGDAIKICESALYVSLPEIEYPSLNMSFEVSGERTVLYTIHKAAKAQGIVKATPTTYLSTHKATASPIQVRIGDYYYNFTYDKVVDYLGYDVIYYYKNVDNVNTVIAAFPSSKNKVKTVDADDITGYYNRTLSYKNGVVSKSVSFTNTADVLFNGVSYQGYQEADFYPEEGYISFIDNDGRGGYDVVNIVSGTNYVADSIDTVYGVISLVPLTTSQAKTSIITSPEKVMNLKINVKGDQKAFPTDIDPGEVLTVYESKPYNGITQNLRIDVSDNVFTETVVEFSQKNGKDYVITQAGNKFELSKNCNRDITIGMPYIFHVALSDKVVWLEKGNNRDYYYGYAMNVGRRSGAFDSKFQIKLLTEAGKIQIFDCADTLTFDGTSVSGASAQSAYQIDNTAIYVEMDDGSMRFIPQVVRYKTNKNGEIYFFDTGYKGANEDAEDLTKVVSVNNSITGNYYVYKAPVNDNTIVFATPIVYSTDAKTLVKHLDAAKDTGFSAGPHFKVAANNLCDAYDGDAVTPLKAAVKYTASIDKLPSTIQWFFVTGVSTGFDYEGNETKILTVITKGTTAEVVLNKKMNIKYGAKMRVGDLWVYRTDKNNEASLLYPVWSMDGVDHNTEDSHNIRENIFSSGTNRVWYVPEILEKSGTWYKLSTPHYKGEDSKKIAATTGINFSGANIMCYNAKTGEIKKLGTSDVPTTAQIVNEGTDITKQHVLILIKSNAVKQVIIVRE